MDQQVDIDVEGLFNEDSLDQILPNADDQVLQAQTGPAPVGLTERIIESQFCGSSSRVAWSRQGHIASISEDNTTVTVQLLRIIPKANEWKLSDPSPIEATFENAVHLSWSPSGVDLAVSDSKGRVSVFSMTTTCLNRLNEARSYTADQAADEPGKTLCSFWFSQERSERPKNIVLSATKSNDRWAHIMAKAKALGPFYPRAYATINQHAVLFVLFQRPSGQYDRVSVPLLDSPVKIYTHAAISPTVQGKMLVVIYSSDCEMSICSVSVTWPAEFTTNRNSTARPTLVVEVLNENVTILSTSTTESTIVQEFNPDGWTMQHLEVIPTSDIEHGTQLPPTIWAIYTLANQAPRITDAGVVQPSVIRRLRVSPTEQKLDSMFDSIQTKSDTSSEAQTVIVVERLPDTDFPQPIMALELVDGGQTVAVTTIDGRTEIWNSTTMTPVPLEVQPNEVTSMAQAGFSFPPASWVNSSAISPNACTVAGTDTDNKIAINQTACTVSGLNPLDPHQSVSLASFILAFSKSCWANCNSDDLISCVFSNFQPSAFPIIIENMYRTLFRDTEFLHEKAAGSEVEKLVTKPIVSKVLSLQLALYFPLSKSGSPSTTRRPYSPIARLWVWTAINLRYMTTSLFVFYKDFQATDLSSVSFAPTFVEMLCNSIKWFFDLIHFIFEQILEIGDRMTNPDMFDRPSIETNLGDESGDGSQGLVALLINCQWTRNFIGAITRAMRAFMDKASLNHPAMNRVVAAITRSSVGKGMNLTAVEKLLDYKHYIRNGLKEGEAMDNGVIATRQIEMITTGRVSEVYQGTLKRLFEQIIAGEDGLRARMEIDRYKLFTEKADLNWLLMNGDLHLDGQFSKGGSKRAAAAMSNGEKDYETMIIYDVHKRKPIMITEGDEQLVRRCARCGSLSEDVNGVHKDWPRGLITYLARCICDGYYVVERLDAIDIKKGQRSEASDARDKINAMQNV